MPSPQYEHNLRYHSALKSYFGRRWLVKGTSMMKHTWPAPPATLTSTNIVGKHSDAKRSNITSHSILLSVEFHLVSSDLQPVLCPLELIIPRLHKNTAVLFVISTFKVFIHTHQYSRLLFGASDSPTYVHNSIIKKYVNMWNLWDEQEMSVLWALDQGLLHYPIPFQNFKLNSR